MATTLVVDSATDTTAAPTADVVVDGATDTTAAPTADVVIDLVATGLPVDRRLLGTNVPAWLGPDRLRSGWLRSALVDAGIATIRMPGGSWSNHYGWSACELRLPTGCIWDGAARPADFAELLVETGLAGIWTVSINETAQSAAALVAYFNGEVGDDTVIGPDRDGVDWKTVGHWAEIRAAAGHREPVRIELWEIGNEVFGGRPESGGDQCASFGWEDVWTCDGTEYVLGNDDHDGFLDIRRAMLDVDPTIDVGAVGVADPSSWSNWGREVIDAAGDELDFYVLHDYGFDSSPAPGAAATRAREMWPAAIESARSSLPDGIPIAITEYNLVSFEAGDVDRSMTTVINAFFIAESIGQFAAHGVEAANQWNLANGTTASGTDYGLVAVDTGERFPQFDAMAVWGRAGESLLPVDHELADVSVYPTRRSDGSLFVILLHPADGSREISISLGDLPDGVAISSTSRSAASPDAMGFDLSGPVDVPRADGLVSVVLPAWSITELEVRSISDAGR